MPAEPAIDVLISEQEIAQRIDSLAAEIAGDFPGDCLVVVILKGSFVFAADLLRALERAGASPRAPDARRVRRHHRQTCPGGG